MSDLIEKDLTTELYREYDFCSGVHDIDADGNIIDIGRLYRIENPQKLFYRPYGTTHRVVDVEGIVHCVPIPGRYGCVLRWQNKDENNPVEF